MAEGLEASDSSISSTYQEKLSSSHLLSSSKHGSSSISKAYRQASTLFLTRRLSEALATIEPIVDRPAVENHTDGSAENNYGNNIAELPPIATASRGARVKVWSLYISIVNAIIELGPEDGKAVFGVKEWKTLSGKARDGSIWEEVVTNGYGGREGDVDADVVINLATLLLSHAPTQTLNQERLETYLSSASVPNLDFTSQLAALDNAGLASEIPKTRGNGANSPRELNSRIKILEIYTLHVLPRNDEWDYAEQLISISEYLDEERREAFLHTLHSLKDESLRDKEHEAALLREQQERLEQDQKEAEARRVAEARSAEDKAKSSREASRGDFAINHKTTNGSATVRENNAGALPHSKSAKPGSASRPQVSPNSESRSSVRKRESPPSIYRRATSMMGSLQKLIMEMGHSISGNPMVLLRIILFLVGLILTFSRRDIREKIRRLTGSGWDKIKGTVGMGVKVSYI
ncbi:hypothetical protein L228DRAFT_283682 [Xylona heveae TC161]|uniref:Peroxin 26 n=1 Tax=Xylona heveae (strain CBS 132557 / TC161) TaxID=1328760 RepID=A0A165FYD8_XYLHT|nr:hypothetical protein L228DRAFT_283682 [Xylona heveae TC161]KZF21530.1 hypothetical protein L228DRAFT_283682 [Xylona heveae TC161]